MLLAQIAGGILGVLVAWVIDYILERRAKKKAEKELAEYKKNAICRT